MAAQLLMIVVVEALDGGVFDDPVHALDLPVRPRVLWFGCSVINVGFCASVFEGIRPEDFAFGHCLLD